MNYSPIIRATVTVDDAVNMYLPSVTIKKGRIPCPLHQGHDYNMALYKDHFYCYVCNMGGDVIKFVSHLFGMEYQDAMNKINEDFMVGLPINGTYKEQKRAEKEYEDFLAEHERRKMREAFDSWIWRETIRTYANAERALKEYPPGSKPWAAAVFAKQYAEYIMDGGEFEWMSI